MKINDIIEEMRKVFVDIKTFDLTVARMGDRISPVEKIVYTIAGAVGLGALGVLTTLIFKGK